MGIVTFGYGTGGTSSQAAARVLVEMPEIYASWWCIRPKSKIRLARAIQFKLYPIMSCFPGGFRKDIAPPKTPMPFIAYDDPGDELEDSATDGTQIRKGTFQFSIYGSDSDTVYILGDLIRRTLEDKPFEYANVNHMLFRETSRDGFDDPDPSQQGNTVCVEHRMYTYQYSRTIGV